MQQYWQQNPAYKVAYDQLLNGPTNVATSGSVIGNYTGARDALRDAENTCSSTAPTRRRALKERVEERDRRHRRLQLQARRRLTPSADRRSGGQPRSSMAT